MTRQEIEAAFLLAGIHLYAAVPVVNPYPAMQRIRGPRWTCMTSLGTFDVGWRKRVISVDWSEIGEFTAELKKPEQGYTRWVTYDDTDQGRTYVHAYSLPKLAEYLMDFRQAMQTGRFVRSGEV